MDEQHLYGNHNLFNSASELEQKGAEDGVGISVNPFPVHLHNFGAYPQQLPVIHENQAIFNAVVPTATWNSVFGWQFDHQIDYPANYPFPLVSLSERNTNNPITDRDGSLAGNTENIDLSSIQPPPIQTISAILQQEVYPKLQRIATSPHFQQLMQSIFGNHINIEKLHEIGNNWQTGDFSTLPLIEAREEVIFPTNTMGAFAGEIDKIYLSQKLITHSESREIADTILEEIGHGLDKQLNQQDTPGDEGQLFTAIITGQHLNNEQIAAIQAEDDSTTIFVDGQSLSVEQSTPSTITIAASDASAAETITGQTANPGRFTITRTGDVTSALTVNYSIAGTATNGTDYTSLPGTVTFAAGASTATINVAPINDSISEPTETLTLNLAAGTGYSLGTAKTATVNIADNDIPVITIAASDAAAGETLTGQTANPGKFTLTRTGNLASALTVNYSIAGTATNGTDYSTLPGTISFAAGASTAVINLTPVDDTTSEATETVTLNLAPGTGYNLGTAKTATVKIADNDIPVITIAASDAAAGETLTGQTANPGKFTLTRTGNLASALTVNYSIAGTATNGTDYTSLPGTVTFAAGASTATINVAPINDSISEPTETLTLNLAAGTGYSLGTAKTATVNIADNDIPVITIAATDATAGETLTTQTANPGRFTVTRIGNLASALTVNYTVAGTATNGTDYTSLPGTVTFAAGASTAVVNVTPTDDTTSEATETVTLNLAAGTGYNLGTAKTATVNIADNDIPVITIAATDATAGETLTTQTANPGRLTLARIGNLASALTVNYTVTGTATNGTDYTGLPGTVSFAAGAATTVIDITPLDETISEATETLTLNLAAGTGYSLGSTTTASVRILDNDIPVITIAATDATAGETLTTQTANPGRFTVTRIGNLASALTVNYTVTGTATNGTDYTSLPGTVTFAAGVSTAIVNVTPTDDAVFEGDETVLVTLSSGTTHNLGTAKTATVKIVDNDPVPYITVTSPNSGESIQAGNSYNITWNDNISENVKIDLFKGGIFNRTIFSSTASDGSEIWTLPANLAAGSDYQIKISSVNNAGLVDFGNANFTVTPSTWNVSFINRNDTNYASVNEYDFTNPVATTTIEQLNLNGNLQFDGVDDYVNLPAMAFGGAVTVEAWVYVDQHQWWQRIIDFGNGAANDNIFLAWSENTGKMAWGIFQGANSQRIITNDVFPTNQWVHVAAVNDGQGNAYIYWNGELKASGNVFSPLNVTRNNNYIGRSNWITDPAYFKGKMDDVRIWNTARTQADIKNSLNKELIGNEAGLLGYWKFNEETGNIAVDSTSAKRNGSLINNPTWNQSSLVNLRVNFEESSPAANVQSDNFAIQAYTTTRLETGKTYQVTTQSDDGTRFFVKNKATGEITYIGSEWRIRGIGEPSMTLFFNVNQTSDYDFYVQGYDHLGSAAFNVELKETPANGKPNHLGLVTDFNKDGKTDILWRNYANRDNLIWLMNGNTRIGDIDVDSSNDNAWYPVATGDFNNDGNVDIMWRYHWGINTGHNVVWFMNGNQHISDFVLDRVDDNNWHVSGTGDFNQDGSVDIIWRNYVTGANSVWLMRGVERASIVDIDPVTDVNWRMSGTGDFNGDGKMDILWRNITNGKNSVWFMNGTTKSSDAALQDSTDLNWNIVGTGDYNSDGKVDILWRNYATGQNWVWLMNGTALLNGVGIDGADTNWNIFGKNDPISIWTAEYFNNTSLSGSPTFTEGIGPSNLTFGFDKNWGLGAPANTPADNFSSRFKTTRYFAPGLYRITVSGDDGVQAWIGNERIISQWNDFAGTYSGYFRSNGGYYDVRVEHKETGRSAGVGFKVEGHQKFGEDVNSSTDWVTGVYHYTGSPSPNINDHVANEIGTIKLARRDDGKQGINLNWGTGSPNGDSRLPSDNFIVRAYTLSYFDGGDYKFRFQSDDFIQLFAYGAWGQGGQHYITPQNQWVEAYGYKEVTYKLPAGWYDLHFQMWEGGGTASVDLSWEKVVTDQPLLTQQSAQYFKDRPQFYTTGNIFAQSMYGSSLVNNTGYTEGNCTWYAHGRVKELGGSTAALNSMSGNANQWHNQLSNGATIVTSNDVQVGDIAQWTRWYKDSNGIQRQMNHVAVVERVYTDSSGTKRVVLSESHYSQNYDGGGSGTLHRIVDYNATNPDRYIRVPKA
jgi:hypothetical protein